MTTSVRILYWKEIPIQVEASDGATKASRPLDSRFQEAADAIAMFDGSYGSDDYLDAWEWQHYAEYAGAPDEVASQVAAMFNSGMPADFVARIRDSITTDSRDPTPGAINSWLE